MTVQFCDDPYNADITCDLPPEVHDDLTHRKHDRTGGCSLEWFQELTCERCEDGITEDDHENDNYTKVEVKLGDGSVDDTFHLHTSCIQRQNLEQRDLDLISTLESGDPR